MVRTRAWGRAFVAGIALGAAACANVLGLGDYADAPGDGGGSGEIGESGGGSVVSDAAHVDDRGGSTDTSAVSVTDALGGGFTIPAGWSLVAFASSAQTTCPTGFGTAPADVVGQPGTNDANACACDVCNVTTPPSCVTGQISLAYDTNGSKTCNTPFQPLANANPGGCNTDNFHGQITPGFDIKITPPGPTGGACATTPTKHPERATFGEHGRVCEPDSPAAAGCVGNSCSAPTIPAPFAACLSSTGNVACPAGPFSVAYHVGTGASFDCAQTCTCTVGATCTGATLVYYTDGTCKGPGPLSTPATGTCVSQGGTGASYGSYKYSATAASPTCTTAGTSAESNVALDGEMTICCAP